MAQKSGRLSKAELAFIKANRDSMLPEQIASKLGRNEQTIRSYLGLDTEIKIGPTDKKEGARWEEIRKHFSSSESKLFREEYERFKSQSEDEFLPAEEAQLIHALTLWILINRSLAKQKEVQDDIERVAKYKRDLESKVAKQDRELTDKELEQIREFKDDIKNAKIDLTNAVNQLTQFSKERNDILKQLKMTRDQRVKELESGKESFVGLMRSLSKKEVRDSASRRMELLRMALEKERDRLGKFTEYPDKSEDQPLLSAETVGLYDEENSNENAVYQSDGSNQEGQGSDGDEPPDENGDSGPVVEKEP